MSSIQFHSLKPNNTVEVRGCERHLFGNFCARLTWGFLEPFTGEYGNEKSILRNIFPSSHYVHSLGGFRQNAQTALLVGDIKLQLGDKIFSAFDLALNTALSLGSDCVRLAARLHGQCEIHAYIKGENRRWLAGIIRSGRASGFFRADMGWEAVIDLLEADDTESVVTSYSVTDSFPNQSVADFCSDDEDAWYSLSFEKQWEMAIAGLYAQGGLELRPENWDTIRFGIGINACHLIDELLKTKAAYTG